MDYEYINIYDFDKKEIHYSFEVPEYNPSFLNLSKNYLFIGYNYSLYIYNKNNFKYLQCKKTMRHGTFNNFIYANEIDEENFFIFGMDIIYFYNKNSFKHYIFSFINIIILFIVLKIINKLASMIFGIYHLYDYKIMLLSSIFKSIVIIHKIRIKNIFHLSDYF